MHASSINPEVIARVTERRGGLRVFDTIDPTRTAHVVVDLQNGFMAPGAICEIGTARDIVPNVNKISAMLRAAGGQVVYIQNTLDAEAIRTWSTYLDYFCSPTRRAKMIEAFTPGAEGHKLWPGLEVLPQDLIVRKSRFGAFAPGSSDLHAILSARGVDTIIITGTATQVCCESTARDAMMRDFRVFMPHDAVTAATQDQHLAGLGSVMQVFADVRPTAALLALVEAG